MSIIHDALKKVQKDLAAKNDDSPQEPPHKAQQHFEYIYAKETPLEVLPSTIKKTARKQWSWWKKSLLIFGILLIIAGAAGGAWYYYYEQDQNIASTQKHIVRIVYHIIHVKPPLPSPKPLAEITIQPAPPIPVTAAPPATSSTLPLPAGPAPNVLNLQGIMSNATGNVALINNKIYQEGDTVNGAKIIKINLKFITILTNNKTETITVKD